MSGTINIGTVAISTEVAERKLKALEQEIGRTIDRSHGLENALREATHAASAQADAFRGLGTQAESMSDRIGRITRNYNEVAEAIQRVIAVGAGIADMVVQADRHERALNSLGRAYSLVRAATNDTVTAEQALVVQQRITQSGLRLSGEELATFLRGARENAVRSNRDVQQVIDQLTDALVQGEAGGLRRFGVGLREGSTRAQAFEATLRHFNTEQARTAPLARTAAESVEGIGRSAREAASILGGGMVSGIAAIGRALTENIPVLNYFIQTLGQFPAAMRALGGELRSADWGRVAAQANQDFNPLASNFEQGNMLRPTDDAAASRALLELGRHTGVEVSGLRVNQLSGSFRQRYSRDVLGIVERVSAIRDPAERSRAFQSELDRLRGTYNSIASQQQSSRVADQNANNRPPTPPPERDPLHVGAQNDSALADAQREYQRLIAEAMMTDANSVSGGGIYNEDTQRFEDSTAYTARTVGARRRGESASDFLQRRNQALQEFTQRARDASREARNLAGEMQSLDDAAQNPQVADSLLSMAGGSTERGANDAHGSMQARRARDQAGAEKDRTNAAFDETNTLLSRTREAWDLTSDHVTQSSQRLAQGVRGAFNTMSSAASSHFQALITGRENIGEALQGMLHDTLTALATESFSKSLFETAQGFAAIATYRYPEAASHFTAAGIYGAVAAGAGVGAYFTRPQGASQSAGAGAGGGRPSPAARGDSPVGSGGGNVTYVINVESALATSAQVQDELVRAESGAMRRGVANEAGRRARQAATT